MRLQPVPPTGNKVNVVDNARHRANARAIVRWTTVPTAAKARKQVGCDVIETTAAFFEPFCPALPGESRSFMYEPARSPEERPA